VSVSSIVLGLAFIQAVRFFLASSRGKSALACMVRATARKVKAMPEPSAEETKTKGESRPAELTARNMKTSEHKLQAEERHNNKVHPDLSLV